MTTTDTAATESAEHEIARLTADIDQLRQDRRAFDERVRDLIIRQHQELDWCTPGINCALDELGLRPFDPALAGTATIRVRFRAHTCDADDARRWAALALICHSNDDDIEISSSEIAIELNSDSA